MKNWSKQKKILVGLLLLFIVSQTIQPPKNRGLVSGPLDIAKVVSVPDNVMSILKKSCYDCHSDNTDYPWYNNITPVNWWLAHHIEEGKAELNFTMFGEYAPRRQAKKLEEVAETVDEGEMPINSYLIAHGDAKLTEEQKQVLVNWAMGGRQQLTNQPAY